MNRSMPGNSSDNSFVPRKDHIPVLDGLRAIAVILVLWAHIPADTFGSGVRLLYFLIKPGYFGVDIFFVLSGFLITRILLAEKERQRPLRLFLFRRFIRIFPIYYLAIFVMIFFAPGEYLIWCAAYLSNYYFPYHPDTNPMLHTWSLAVEEHFYMIWPFAIYWLSVSRSRAVALWGFMLLAVVSAVVVCMRHDPEFSEGLVFRGSNFRCASLAMGSLFAYSENWIRDQRGNALRLALMLGLPGIFILASGQFLEKPLELERWTPLIRLIGFTLYSGAVLLVVIGFAETRNVISVFLSNTWMRLIGRISYGVYLYHYPIYMAFGVLHFPQGQAPTALMSLLAALSAIGVASVSYYLIERPLLKWKDKFH